MSLWHKPARLCQQLAGPFLLMMVSHPEIVKRCREDLMEVGFFFWPFTLELVEQMAEKIGTELQDSPNVYYEICNEPYFGGITPQWSQRIAEVIRITERGHSQHLIAQRYHHRRTRKQNIFECRCLKHAVV